MDAIKRSRSSRDRYYLLQDGRGMGGAGHPPGHYLREFVVVNGVDRGNGYQGYMSVDYALSEENTALDAADKERLRAALRYCGVPEFCETNKEL